LKRVDKGVLKLAIIGTGDLITESLLAVIAEHSRLSGEVVLLGDEAQAGESVEFGRQTLVVLDVGVCDFAEIDILIYSGELLQKGEWLGRALDAGCVVVDVGGHLGSHEGVPYIVAGVNEEILETVTRGSLIALPDAATVQCATLLKPLLDTVGLERVSLFSCHAVSELGRSGVEEMAKQTAQMLNGKPARPLLFPSQVAFNLVPRPDGAGTEQLREFGTDMATGLRQVLDRPALPITVSSCWAPVFFGHTQIVHFSTRLETEAETLKRIFERQPYMDVKGEADYFPTVVTDASGKDLLTVGRLAAYAETSTEFSLWTVADNLRYGIAGNAVKIIEVLVKRLSISYS
jgi:aspartate-semialdehyde dehydrogenase